MRFGRLIAFGIAACACVSAVPASALDSIWVNPRVSAIVGIAKAGEHHKTDTNRVQVSTAPGPDGIVRRIEVRAQKSEGATNWIVFALTNNTDEAAALVLSVPHASVVDVTPSQGTREARETTKQADVFPLWLDPGSVITYVAELASNTVPEMSLWNAGEYRKQDPSYKGRE